RARAKLVQRPARLRDADDRNVQGAPPDEGLERGKDLLVGEVAGGAEEDERVRGLRCRHECFSSWPPNSRRMADMTRLAKSASPREAKRSPMALARMGAGTLSSIAARRVQRPSPESETRPVNSVSSGLRTRAAAVRSSSHDAMTLPRLHTSAISGRSR